LFTVGLGVTLTLDTNVTLQGRSDNTYSLVSVGSGGTLDMKGNAKITGNAAASSNGGGVYVSASSSFTSISGTISGPNEGINSNTVKINSVAQTDRGAAIYVDSTHRRETVVNQSMSRTSDGIYTGQWTD
jgi:hypothetical protein